MGDVDKRGQEGGDCSNLTKEKGEVARSYIGRYYVSMLEDKARFRAVHSRPLERKLQLSHFDLLTVIGRGAFGEVRLCSRKKNPNKIMAMKKLHKQHMVNRNQVQHVRAERDVLVQSGNRQMNPWITELYYSFQDKDHLYLVMEFLPGGDLMTWLIKYDVFDENIAQFYVAELILAVHSIHKMREEEKKGFRLPQEYFPLSLLFYAHRDIKPDNILLDKNGHIKLTDFGFCKQIDIDSIPVKDILECDVAEPSPVLINNHYHNKKATWKDMRCRKMFYSAVGSPGYVAPEVLMKQGYSMDCDWWSVGIILYEMLCGYPPFYADDVMQTCHKIIKWKEYLDFPPDGSDALSQPAVDLIRKLLCDPEERLSFDAILSDRFFDGINWGNLRHEPPPFLPQLSGDHDTQYFDVPEEEACDPPPERTKDTKYLFYGFSARLRGDTTCTPSRPKARLPLPDEFRGGADAVED